MLSNEYVTKLLNEIRESCYIAAHFDDPMLAGAYASEVSGGGYARVLATFTEPSSRSTWVTHPVVFSGLLRTRITHVCGWSAQKEGDLIFAARLASPINISEGGGFQLIPGDIAVSID